MSVLQPFSVPPSGEAVGVGVRHKETFCTGAQRNGPKRTEAREVKTGGKQNGPERTGIRAPLSGPRYRGSNPCLPANQATHRQHPYELH